MRAWPAHNARPTTEHNLIVGVLVIEIKKGFQTKSTSAFQLALSALMKSYVVKIFSRPISQGQETRHRVVLIEIISHACHCPCVCAMDISIELIWHIHAYSAPFSSMWPTVYWIFRLGKAAAAVDQPCVFGWVSPKCW